MSDDAGDTQAVPEPLYRYIRDLKKLSEQQLCDEYDRAVTPGQQSPSRAEFYRDELRRRQAAKTERLIAVMTFAILVLTIANVYIVARG